MFILIYGREFIAEVPENADHQAFKIAKKDMTFKTIITIASLCFATESFAQGFTPAYVERADSADHYIKAERWADAERNLKTALRLEPANPGNALLLSNLGYVQTMLGKFDDALESYDVSLSIAPKSAVVALKPGTHLRIRRKDSRSYERPGCGSRNRLNPHRTA